MNPMYLGDAVYAQLDQYHRVILTTDTHDTLRTKRLIILEPEVIAALRLFLDARDAFILNGPRR
jgi:hypothetical protein